MLKGLLFFIIIILVVVSAIVLFAISIVLRFLKRMRKMATGELDEDEDEEYERQSTSRRQHQYAFRGGRTSRAKPNGEQQGYQQTRTEDGKVIIDNRQPEERKRKSIDADEGEYVEFTEE